MYIGIAISDQLSAFSGILVNRMYIGIAVSDQRSAFSLAAATFTNILDIEFPYKPLIAEC